MLADCVGVLIVHDTAHGTSTPFHYVMYTLLNKDSPTIPLLVHGYLPVLDLIGVACQLIGHAASIGHTYLVGRNRNAMAAGILVQNDCNAVLLVHTAKGVGVVGVVSVQGHT